LALPKPVASTRGPSAARLGVAVLGSTGSIGRQALDVLDGLADRFAVVALAAGRDAIHLAEQATRHRPRVVHLADEEATIGLELPAGTQISGGADALTALATRPDVDIVVVATGGMVSLAPVIAALEAGKVVATANKETLVAGGHLVMPLARRLAAAHGPAKGATGAAGDGTDATDAATAARAWLRPIDSEHSAIWQCLAGERRGDIARLVLTASGGPFRDWSAHELANATPADALAHPTWRMGAKITIDSATLMNKGLEVLEARWLYDVPDQAVDVVIHPQSIIHSLVEFADGSLKAQLGLPDMRLPIQYALTYPRHVRSPAPSVALTELPALTFEAPDEERFPALSLAREAGRQGQWASAAMICADEVAVQRFLDGSLDFAGITALCARAVARFGSASGEPSLADLVALEADVRAWAATETVAPASGRP
jgi:1-deoxy-D-xylulose-5-phosphate reductoisomerase